MTFDYTRARATADRLIAKFGQAAVLEQPYVTNGTGYDPTQAGWPTEIAVTVVDLNIKARDSAGVVMQARRTLYMAVPSVVPETDWRVQVAGKWHRIIEVRPLSPGGIGVMYEVDLEV